MWRRRRHHRASFARRPEAGIQVFNLDTLESRVLLTGTVSFSAPVLTEVGHDPGVAVVDFNADGKPDLAVADATGHTIQILRGDGSGRFVDPVAYEVGGSANFIAPGDFNGDGKQDLALSFWFGSDVGVMLGDGQGGFGPVATFSAGGPSPLSTRVADFNRDGKLDLATSGWFGGGVRVLFGDGAGHLAEPVIYPAGSNTQNLVLGDFNADSHPDLAVTNYSEGTVTVLTNDGAGRFTTVDFPAGDQPITMFAGDFNHDGRPDLAVGGGTSLGGQEPAVRLLLNDGAGRFGAPVPVAGPELSGFSVADFNGDGDSDLAVRSATAGRPIGVLLGDGRGGFADPIAVPAGNTLGAIAADFNGDGRPDLGAFDAAVGSPLLVLLNTTGQADVLTVEGTAGNDRIIVTRGADGGSLIATLNGVAVANRRLTEVTSIVLRGLAGNDSLDVANNITLPAVLEGGSGDDLLKGGGGPDRLAGGDGDDVLDGRRGADVFLGGAGRDTADYSARTQFIHFGPGKIADDGEAGERDNVGLDVEDCYGGRGDDYLNGSSADNRLYGGPGNDVLIGNGGRDTLLGGKGDDRLFSLDGVKDRLVDGGGGLDTARADVVDELFGVENTTTNDDSPPRVVGSTIMRDGVLPTGDNTIILRFSKPMKTGNLDRTDVYADSGLRPGRFPDSLSYDATGTVLTVRFKALKDDIFVIAFASGDGAFEDLAGHDLDGEPTTFPIPPNVSGDGTAGGDFAFLLSVDSTAAVPLGAVPGGGGTLSFESILAPPQGDTDSFTVDLRQGQTVGVDVTPQVEGILSGVTLFVRLEDAAGNVLADDAASAMYEDVSIPSIAAPSTGTYVITVGCAPGEIGLFRGRAIVGP